MPDLVDLELLDPGRGEVPAEARAVVRIDGTPVGMLRESRTPGAEAPRERALEGLGDGLSTPVAARRLRSAVAADRTARVTVIVCTRDRAHLLDGCLAALAALEHDDFEVVVVDNAPSGDETRLVAERWKVRYVVEPLAGLDRARNRGVAEAASPIVAFTDDDARPEPGWLSALVQPFDSPSVHGVTGLVLPAELRTPSQVLFEDVYGGMGKGYRLRIHTEEHLRPSVRPERVGVGCNMAFRRDTVLGLGGFDPALDVGTRTGGGGDLDMFERVLESSAMIVYVPDAVVRHLHRADPDGLRRQLFDNGRAYGAMLTAAFVRGDRRRRRAVAGRYARWLVRWHAARLVGSVLGREQLPLRLVASELAGAPLGPLLYLSERACCAARGAGVSVAAAATSRRHRLGGVAHVRDTVARLVYVEFATRHRGSALGWLWAVGPPLLMLVATSFVFTRVIPLDIPDYPVFLLVGILSWTLFARGVGDGTSALEQRRELVLRPGFATQLLPIVAVLVALVDYVLAVPVLIIALAVTTGVHATWLLDIPVLAIQVLLCAGIALLLSPLQIYLRDVRQLVALGIAVGFWLTPVFYERDQVPDEISWLYTLNPMQYLLEAQRELLIEGTIPELMPLALVAAASCALFVAGWTVFSRMRDALPEQM